jgi:hypothetical protein
MHMTKSGITNIVVRGDSLVTAFHPEQPPSVFRYRVPGLCCFPLQRRPPWAGHQRWRRQSWEAYSSASSTHQPVDSRSHPHDLEPLASRRLPPASLDPNFSSPLRSMCWVTVQATRQVCCVGNLAQHPDGKKVSEALGNPARKGSSKEAKVLEVGGIVDTACIGS